MQKSANRMVKLLIHSSSSRCRAMLDGLLAADDVAVTAVATREEFLERCESELFDRIITEDARMFMNGCDAMARIRAAQPQRTEIVVISCDLSEETVLSLLECGVDQYLSFPATPTRLKRKLGGR